MQDSRLLHVSLNFFELSRLTIILVVLLIAAVTLIGLPLRVEGQSMEPNFHSGELVFVEHLNYGPKQIRRGDVVAARFPADPAHTKLIKRVVGLPGDRVRAQDGQLFVNDQLLSEPYNPIVGTPPYQEIAALTLGPDQYFLSGDNRPGSSDSRLWGPVVSRDIEGRVTLIIWPFSQTQTVERTTY